MLNSKGNRGNLPKTNEKGHWCLRNLSGVELMQKVRGSMNLAQSL